MNMGFHFLTEMSSISVDALTFWRERASDKTWASYRSWKVKALVPCQSSIHGPKVSSSIIPLILCSVASPFLNSFSFLLFLSFALCHLVRYYHSSLSLYRPNHEISVMPLGEGVGFRLVASQDVFPGLKLFRRETLCIVIDK